MSTITLDMINAYYKRAFALASDLSLGWSPSNPLQKRTPRYDPQGMVITELLPEDFETPLIDIADLSHDPYKPNPNKPVYARIDICGTPLEHKFKKWVLQNCRADEQRTLSRAYEALIASPSRTSIIPLQEEIEMHIHLRMQVLRGAPCLHPPTWSTIWDNTAAAINGAVQQTFQQALLAAYDETAHTLDIAQLNQHLARARIPLAEAGKTYLATQLSRYLNGANEDYLTRFKERLTHRILSTTMATAAHAFQVDSRNQLATLMQGTYYTAHNKNAGGHHLAFRRIHRAHYDPETRALSDLHQTRQEIRVPSLAILTIPHADGSRTPFSHNKAVRDVADKLTTLSKQFDDPQEPFVYNLLTSLHTKWFDHTPGERKNRQRASAARILKGAHLFNQQQIQAGKGFCYVQNIPINQHTRHLGYHRQWDGATAEATLMAEIALLYTLSKQGDAWTPKMREAIRIQYESAHTQYRQFLMAESRKTPITRQGQTYFKDSSHGKVVIQELTQFKRRLHRNLRTFPTPTTHRHSAAQALCCLFAQDLHWKKQFGTLTQSLSVFLQAKSVYGCKSGNERFQMVANRVELLVGIEERSIRNQPLHLKEMALIGSLNALTRGKCTARHVQAAVDSAYNTLNVQGSAINASTADQGGPSKIACSQGQHGELGLCDLDTNRAESQIPNLCSKGASNLQSHKDKNPRGFLRALRAALTAVQTPSSRFRFWSQPPAQETEPAVQPPHCVVK